MYKLEPKQPPAPELVKVKITGPGAWADDRLYMPGETATVAPDIADAWIQEARALAVGAEKKR